MNAKRAHVLVVEDEPTLRGILVTLMQDEGHEVTAVPDAETALSTMARGGVPDLAILDKNLGAMNGLALGRALATQCPAPRLMLVTGYPGINSAREALESGFTGYLVKPFAHLSEVTAEVRRVLSLPVPWPAAHAARLARGRMAGDINTSPPGTALIVAPLRASRVLEAQLGSPETRCVDTWSLAQQAWASQAFDCVVAQDLPVLIEARGRMPDASLLLAAEPSLADIMELIRLGAACVEPPALAMW